MKRLIDSLIIEKAQDDPKLHEALLTLQNNSDPPILNLLSAATLPEAVAKINEILTALRSQGIIRL